jgi:hypothetical protein
MRRNGKRRRAGQKANYIPGEIWMQIVAGRILPVVLAIPAR